MYYAKIHFRCNERMNGRMNDQRLQYILVRV